MDTTSATVMTTALMAVLVGAVSAQPEEMPHSSVGCEAPLAAPGDYKGTFEMDDGSDDHWVVVPEGYADRAPAPLVLWLSNADGSADANYAGWRPELDGIDALFAVAGTSHRSDPDAMLALVDRLEVEYCIDTRHIHPMGSAWTAGPAAALACAAPERVASFYAGMGGFEVADCDPARSVPVLSITGDADRSAVTASIKQWQELNGTHRGPSRRGAGFGCQARQPWRLPSGRDALRHRGRRTCLHLPPLPRARSGVVPRVCRARSAGGGTSVLR